MVLGHVVHGDLQKFIFVFHMPFFFVIAGYLLNLDKWGGVENYKKFSAKLVKRLLLPYFIAEILFYPIWFVVCHEAGYLKYLWGWCKIDSLNALLDIFISDGASNDLILGQLWFLPVLLFAEIIFIELYNRLYKASTEFFVAAIFLVAYVGFNVKNFSFLLLGIDIALAAQIFLLAGVLIRKNNLVERIDIKTYAVLTLILMLAVYLNSFVDMHSRRYGNALLFYAGGITGSLLLMKISALITGGKIFSLISDCGRQSMMILVLHPIVANIAYDIIVDGFNFPKEKILTEPAVIFPVTVAGVLIPLFVAKKFGKRPVLKIFCP